MKKIAVLMMIMIIGVLMLAGVCYAQEEDAPQLYCEENGLFESMSENFNYLIDTLDTYAEEILEKMLENLKMIYGMSIDIEYELDMCKKRLYEKIPIVQKIKDAELLQNSGMSAEMMYEDNGVVIIHVGYDENICNINIGDLQFGEVYRLSISGVAEDGNEFYYTEKIDSVYDIKGFSGEDADYRVRIPISNKEGFYGPYDLELVGGGHVLSYEVYFYVGCDNPNEDAPDGILDKGGVMQPAFMMQPADLKTINFVYPLAGSYVCGKEGYAIECVMDVPFESMEDGEKPIKLELLECATGRIISEVEPACNADELNHGMGMLEYNFTIPCAFISGGEYELRAQACEGKYSGSTRFILVDEETADADCMENIKEISVAQFIYEEGRFINVPLNDYPSGQPITCNFPKANSVGFFARYEADNKWEYCRMRFSGTAKDGKPILYDYIIDNADGGFYLDIAGHKGSYGPFTLEIICGKNVKRYELIFNFAEDGDSDGAYEAYIDDKGKTVTPLFWQNDDMYSFAYPVNGSTLMGPQGGAIDVRAVGKWMCNVQFALRNVQTDEMIKLEPPKNKNPWGTWGWEVVEYENIAIPENFEDGAWYDLIAYGVDDGIEYGSTRIRLVEERIKSERERALSDDYTVCREKAIEIIQTAKNRFSEIPAKGGMIGYSIDAENAGTGVLNSFSVYAPSVEAEQVEEEIAYPDGAANWMIYDAYTLQKDRRNGETELINIDTLNALFGGIWREIEVFEHAKGYAESEDGTYYYWMPVYYPDAEGSIYEDALGLFVYILREGVDTEYYAQRRYFAVCTGEYNVEKLFITDPETVKAILTAMRSRGDGLELTEDEASYEILSMDSTGTAVRKIQTALVDKGFMTSSIDGYYGPMTEAAVIAYQQAMGLEATGVADAETQRMLLSRDDEKSVLLDWLDRH